MNNLIRAELSVKNKYWISKHRHYELKHFCLQYPIWKKTYLELLDSSVPTSSVGDLYFTNDISDPTARRAVMKVYYSDRIKLVEQAAANSDKYLYEYILKAATEGRSYTYLRNKLNIPCGRDMFYDRYRKFFWLLDKVR